MNYKRLISFDFMDAYKSYGIFFIRLAFGFHLMYFTADNVFSESRMEEFEQFVQANGFIFPAFSARLSVYAQFICGSLIILGLLTRTASFIMLINFVVAYVMVHWGQTYPQSFQPLQLIAVAICLLCTGPGAWALANFFKKKEVNEFEIA